MAHHRKYFLLFLHFQLLSTTKLVLADKEEVDVSMAWNGGSVESVKAKMDETLSSFVEGGTDIAKQIDATIDSVLQNSNEAKNKFYEGGREVQAQVTEKMYQSVEEAQSRILEGVKWWNLNLNHIGIGGWRLVSVYVDKYRDWIHTDYSCNNGEGQCLWFGVGPWSGGVRGMVAGLADEMLKVARFSLVLIYKIPLLYMLALFTLLCLVFGSWTTLRLPILAFVMATLVFEFWCYWIVRILIVVLELLPPVRQLAWYFPLPIPRLRWTSKRRRLSVKMKEASTYEEWRKVAVEMSELHGREAWKDVAEDPHYHCRVVIAATQRLEWARTNGDYLHLIETLKPCMTKNFGGTMNLKLYSHTHSGTKKVVDEFFKEVVLALNWIADAKHTSLKLQGGEWEDFKVKRLRFLKTAKRSYGNTAFLMSGGATLGLYHIGIIKGLAYSGFGFPNVICGTSAGSVLAAFMGCRTDSEIRACFEEGETDGLDLWWGVFGPNGPLHGSWYWKLRQLHLKGRMYDYNEFIKHLAWFCGEGDEALGLVNPTFAEVFERTGRLINITCTPFKTSVKGSPPLILNHLTAPNVTLTSAVCASSCVPMLIEPVALLEKQADGSLRPYVAHDPMASKGREGVVDFEVSLDHIRMRDGTFESDVPVQAISELFNCHFSIVSQVNPHIIPFFYQNRGRDGRPSSWRLWAGGWRGGFILSALELWLKEDMLKSLRVMAGLDLLIEVFGVNWSYLYLQDGRGDVTMLPDPTFMDYVYLIDNMDNRSDLKRRVSQSQHNFWQCFSRIEHRMSVQDALDRACERHGIVDSLNM